MDLLQKVWNAVCWLPLECTLYWLNNALAVSLTFGGLILLRPVTNRLLRPKYRVKIWMLGWVCGWMVSCYRLVGLIRIFPVTLHSLLVPRTEYNTESPAFLPRNFSSPGQYSLALPGGGEWVFTLSKGTLVLLILVVLGAMALSVWLSFRQERALREAEARGEVLDIGPQPQLDLDEYAVKVLLCKDIPTSYVRSARIEGDPNTRYIVCIQKELSEERRRLVLLHELEHIRGHHAWIKSLLTMFSILCWWNPLLWLANRLTCRDMELACDEAVLDQLTPAERREYARTLVDLGAGKHLWGAGMTFGECDAVLRVKRAVDWKPEKKWGPLLSWGLALALMVFCYTEAHVPASVEAEGYGGYVISGRILEDLSAQYGIDGVEVWDGSGPLLVLDTEGNWYRCELFQWSDGRMSTGAVTATQPDLKGQYQMYPELGKRNGD